MPAKPTTAPAASRLRLPGSASVDSKPEEWWWKLACVFVAMCALTGFILGVYEFAKSGKRAEESSGDATDAASGDSPACENSCLAGLSVSFDDSGTRPVWVLEDAHQGGAVNCAFIFCVGTSASVECYSGALAQAARAGAIVLVGDAFGKAPGAKREPKGKKVDSIAAWTEAAESCVAALRRQLSGRNPPGSSIRLCIAGHSGGAPIALWLAHRLAVDREAMLGATTLSKVDLMLVHPGAVPSLNVPSSPDLKREGAPFRGWTVAGGVLPHASLTIVTGDYFPATNTSLRKSNFAAMLSHQGVGATDFDKAPDGMVDTEAAYVVQQYGLAKSPPVASPLAKSLLAARADADDHPPNVHIHVAPPRAQLLTFPYSHASSWQSPMTVYDELFRVFTSDGFEGAANFSGRSVAAQSLLVERGAYPTWGSSAWKDAMGLRCQYGTKTSSEIALVGTAGHGSGTIKFHQGPQIPVAHCFLTASG